MSVAFDTMSEIWWLYREGGEADGNTGIGRTGGNVWPELSARDW